MDKKILKYTKLSSSRRGKILRWFSRQNTEILHIIFQKQKEHYFQISSRNEPDKSILYLSALFLAVDDLYIVLKEKKGKNRVKNIESVSDPITMQARQLKQRYPAQKYERLLDLQSKLLALIDEEGLSFRQVEKFFKTYHRLEVSHTLIRQVYLDLKGK